MTDFAAALHHLRGDHPPRALLPAEQRVMEAAFEVDVHEPWASDRDADFEALVSENRGERQAASALEWMERGGAA
jgi:hypothetical protein